MENVELRQAEKNDLIALETMYRDLSQDMCKVGVGIWNEYYPYEDFESEIGNGELYVISIDDEVVVAFSLSDSMEGNKCFNWSQGKALYLSHLGVRLDHRRQGLGTLAVECAMGLARENGCDYVRLSVVDINEPATRLYLNNGFVRVEGINKFYSELLTRELVEYGYERACNN